jgi:signal transduction histidine kinase
VRLVTDPDRLAQVFINLVMNCRKYCRVEEPRLRILSRLRDGVAEIDFVDNGPGIATGEQEMIFEKFARGGDSRAAGGAGLGLAICREILARLGGSISYLPGQGGAAFRVRLPLAMDRLRAAE